MAKILVCVRLMPHAVARSKNSSYARRARALSSSANEFGKCMAFKACGALNNWRLDSKTGGKVSGSAARDGVCRAS